MYCLQRYIHKMQNHNRQQLGRDGEDVSQMETETLLPAGGQPSGELALKKGWPCGDGMATEVGTFSSIRARWRTLFVFDP